MTKLTASIVSSCLLAACGGGGGDSSGYRLPASITVNAYEGETIGVHFKGYAAKEPQGYLGVQVTVDGTYFDPDVPEPYVNEEELSMSVSLTLRPTLAANTYSTQIGVLICEDEDCESRSIPVTIHVAPDPHNPSTPDNGDFSSGATGWSIATFGGGAATLSATAGELRVDLTSGGSNPYGPATYAVRLVSPPINLEEGTTYRLSFRARAASTPRAISVSVSQGADRDGDGGTYLYRYMENVSLTGEGATYTSPSFTMWETNRAANINFYVGGSTADVFLDDVVVEVVP